MTQVSDSLRISNEWATQLGERPIAVVGSLPPRAMAAIRAAAESLNVGIAQAGRNGDPSAVLDHEKPLAVIAAVDSSAFGRACALVRRRRGLARVPVIGACERRRELSFAELFHAGGDDLVDIEDPSALVRRIRALRSAKPHSPAAAQRAVVVGEDLSLYIRAFSNAGIEPVLATTAEEAIALSRTARFVLASDEMDAQGGVAALAKARAQGSSTPWVIVAAPKRVAAARTAAKDLGSVVVLDAYAPAENALFMANELTRPAAGMNARANARLLFGTSVTFRHAGRDDGDDVGFTYNVSAKGVFVRTLAPLSPGDDVWLELWAPRSARRVRLVGRVVWQRAFGPDDNATVPAGFAVRIDGGLPGDMERWSAGCAALQREQMST